jgi:hypothetical protein
MAWTALTGPTPEAAGEAGSDVLDDGQQQGPQPTGLLGTRHRDLLAGDEQDTPYLPVTVGARHREPAGVQARRITLERPDDLLVILGPAGSEEDPDP